MKTSSFSTFWTVHRLWIPVLLLGGALSALVVVGLRSELDGNFRSWATAALVLLGGLLLLGWFLLLSRFSARLRLMSAAVILVLGLLASQTLRVDGVVNGTGLPRLGWRWVERSMPALTQAEEGAVSDLDGAVPGALDVGQFFGQNRDGVVRGVVLEDNWEKISPKEWWRQPIGAGWSAFAVAGGRVFTQEQRGGEELVTCYALLNGRLLWAHAEPVRFTQWQGGEGPRATPTVLNGRVYSYGATGILSCLEATDGRRIWSRNVLEEAASENLEWGTSSSPLVVDDMVVVTAGKTVGPVLLAFDCATGALRWKAGNDQASYASPLLVTLAGRRVILSNNAAALTMHDVEDGRILAEHEWGDRRWPKASQPVVLPGDRVFLSAGYGMGCLMLQVRAGEDGVLRFEELWRGMRMKTQFSSVAFWEGHLVGLDDGRLACLDPESGERLWKDGRFGAGQSLLVDGLAIVQTEPGPVVLARADKDGFEELGRLEALSSRTWNHPTLAGRFLLVRNDKEAVCYEVPVKRMMTPSQME